MGVLDDAIRQHLELKRAHGAAEDDVRQQEHEALGPARREQAPEAEAAAPDAEAAAPDAEAAAPEAEAAPVEDAPVTALPESPFEPIAEPEPDAPTGNTPTRGFPAVEEEPGDEQPAEDAPAEEPTGDEDVLEETPEFLQETPEHDRLWFEQKPPRDFDFDE